MRNSFGNFRMALVFFAMPKQPTTVQHAIEYYRNIALQLRNGQTIVGIDELADSPRPITRAVGHLCSGYCHHIAGEFRQALALYQQSCAVLRSPSHDLLLALVHDAMAWSYLYLGNYDQCITHALEVVRVGQLYSNDRCEASGLACVAQVYASLGALQKARRTMERALAIFQRLGLHGNVISTLSNLATLAGTEGKRLEQRQLLDEAFRRLEAHTDATSQASLLRSDGTWYAAGGDSSEALKRYEMAEELFQRLGNRNAVAEVQIERAAALMRMGAWRKGEELARAARTIFRETAHRRFEGHAEQTIAYAWYLAGNTTRCLKHLRVAERIAHDIGARADVVEVSAAMAEIYAEQKDYQRAYKHALEAMAAQRSIDREGRSEGEADAEIVTHVERYLEQAEHHRRVTADLRRAIAAAERQRDDAAHQVEQYRLLVETLEKLARGGIPRQPSNATLAKEFVGVIAAYRTHLQGATLVRDTHDTLEQRASELRKRHQGLTAATARVAAMVQAGMTTKDIAIVQRVSTRTVEHQRLHIRKVLSVPPDVDLVDALRGC